MNPISDLLNMTLTPSLMACASVAMNLSLYFGMTLVLLPLLRRLMPVRFASHILVRRPPSRRQIRRELLSSLRTIAITGINGYLIGFGVETGWLKMYFHFNHYSLVYVLASIPVLVLLNDAYYYWTHRLLHHPRLYKRLHKHHHLSIEPTPFAAYSFSVGEAVINGAFLPLVLLVMPVHPFAIFHWLLIMMLYNALGHCSVDIIPDQVARKGLSVNVRHHYYHHVHFNNNFGLYLPLWDRLMGTEDPAYTAELTAAPRADSSEGQPKGRRQSV